MALKANVLAAGVLALTDAEAMHLKGPVRSVTITNAGFKFERQYERELEQPAALNARYFYDDLQLLQRFTSYLDQRVLFDNQYEYGDNGIITSVIYTPDGETSKKQFTPGEGIEHMYNLRPFGITRDGGLGTYTYDDDGNETDVVIKEPKGTTRRVRTFGASGIQIDERAYLNGALQYTLYYSHKFDSHGNWVEEFAMYRSAEHPRAEPFRFEKVYREIKYY